MKNKFKTIFLLIFFSCILLGGIYCYNTKIRSPTYYTFEDYISFIQDIGKSFSFTNYEEVMNEKNHMLALPLNYESINSNDTFIGRQKLFVFKSKTSSTLIMLQISYNGYKADNWDSSFNFSPELFNSLNSEYGNFYNEKIPNIQLASNSFNYKGCSFNTLCLSDNSKQHLASSELIAFSNEFIKFITTLFSNN